MDIHARRIRRLPLTRESTPSVWHSFWRLRPDARSIFDKTETAQKTARAGQHFDIIEIARRLLLAN
jgi:hypothetical protein